MDDSGYFSVQVCIESLSISVVLYIYIVDVYVVFCVYSMHGQEAWYCSVTAMCSAGDSKGTVCVEPTTGVTHFSPHESSIGQSDVRTLYAP